MVVKILSILLIPIFLATLSVSTLAKDDLEIVNGEHWSNSSLEQKRAFLYGVGNVLEIEEAMAGDNYESMRGRSIVPVLLEGLSGTSIDDMVTQLDQFFTKNPDQKGRSVIGVLYTEMARPNLKNKGVR
jgi:hypothetical protein